MTQDWRPETNAEDFLRFQKKRLTTEERRPVIRQAGDLVGPGIASEAVRLSNWNDVLATFNGYYASEPGALMSAPTEDEAYVGLVVSDGLLGGTQRVTGLSSGLDYSRVFIRNAADPSSVGFGEWVLITAVSSIVRLENWPLSLVANTWTDAACRNPVIRGNRIDNPTIGSLRVLRDGWYEVGAQCSFNNAQNRALMRVTTGNSPDTDIIIGTEGGGAAGGTTPALNASTVIYLLAGTILRQFLFATTAGGTANKFFYAREA